MTERLLLDEHYSPVIATVLRERGFDVRAVAVDPDLVGQPDATLITVAAAAQRRIVTENVKDFVPLTDAARQAGQPTARLLLVSPKRFPRGEDRIGPMARALDEWLRRPTPAGHADQEWLA
ncbi:MAG: DUF5615 family PIN-like protein [Bifidobacteriaceae bacterium]|nr:DUF5615 family PIN-like protein [Bifidobacteriaceae bacterium]